jgi:hypothetical protein
MSPEEALESVKTVSQQVEGANAVGDLASLTARLDALRPVIEEQREARKAERVQKAAEAKDAKEKLVAEAEKIAEGSDWRAGANRLRTLLDEWKALPRIDRASDDALWRRFSSARTSYTRRRKSHFAEQNEKREASKVVKERLVKDAEELADSTEWGPTAGRYRDLMRQWKAAGPAPREVDDKLWARFRAAQDTFFGARDAIQAEENVEQRANLERKEALLAEGESMLPVTDAKAARDHLRELLDRWDAIGKVPRDAMRPIDNRLRTVEDAVRAAEDEVWQRSNPEARARAEATVQQLRSSIADLESRLAKATEQGNDKKAREARESLDARRSWLAEAERALSDFS